MKAYYMKRIAIVEKRLAQYKDAVWEIEARLKHELSSASYAMMSKYVRTPSLIREASPGRAMLIVTTIQAYIDRSAISTQAEIYSAYLKQAALLRMAGLADEEAESLRSYLAYTKVWDR